MKNNYPLLIIFALLITCCAQNFTHTHKLYNKTPIQNEHIGYVKLSDAFMLTRANWFAEKLNIQSDSIYGKLEILTDSVIYSELSKNGKFSIISADKKESFAKETLKMDKTIFIKTRLPEQGVEIVNDSGTAPNFLFIIHEYTVGGDLDAENFYDYTKANLEMAQKKKFKNLSVIATFTFWDNKKQIPLKSGIISVQKPIKDDSIEKDFFIDITKMVVKECLGKL